jgi:hypothetical protein
MKTYFGWIESVLATATIPVAILLVEISHFLCVGKSINHLFGSYTNSAFFVNRTLALKETANSTKHLKKNKNYNEIIKKPFIFNLQTVSTARRRCRSSLSRSDVVGCGWEVAERVKKTTSVPKTKKKEELLMKLLHDPKIPTARQNP